MSMIGSLVNIESIKFWLKGVCDALASVNKRSEDAHRKYDDLFDKFTRYSVISNEIEGRKSQLVSISTAFGYETQNDPVVREFTFNHGAILRYYRVLSVKHTDPLEVVNYKTMINILSQYVGQQDVENDQKYMAKTGDTASGSYTFNAGANGSGSVTFNVMTLFNAPSKFTKTLKCINPVADDEAVNLGYIKNNISDLLVSATPQPVFISGKIAFAEGLTTGNASAYTVENIEADGKNAILVKILSYNTNINDCKSWIARFGNTPLKTIPGYEGAVGSIPTPVNFALVMEYKHDLPNSSDFNSGQTFRTLVPNQITTESGYLKWTLGISVFGDLCLIMNTEGNIKIPTAMGDIDFSSSIHLIRFFVIVNSWSYLPYNSKYLDMNIGHVSGPQIVGPNELKFSTKTPFSHIYKGGFYYRNFPEMDSDPVFQTDDSRVTVIEDEDGELGALSVILNFPARLELPFSLSVVIKGFANGVQVATKIISITLENRQLEIVPMQISVDYSDYLDAFPYTPIIKPFARQQTKNSVGDIQWSISSAANCDCSIIPTTGKLVVNSITANGAASAQIMAKDSRYAEYAGTFACTDGESLTLTGTALDPNLISNEIIVIDNISYDIINIISESPLIIEIGDILPVMTHTATAFSIVIGTGKAIATVPIILRNID